MAAGVSGKMNTDKPVRLLYLTCTELIANYGIFDTQVKSLLKILTYKYHPTMSVHLFSLVPVLRLVKWRGEVVFSRYKQSFDTLQQELATENIQVSIRPLLSVYPFDTWRVIEMLVALPLAMAMLVAYIKHYRINLLHCRSYHAGLLGLTIKKLLNFPYIFDPRSSWIGEQMLIGKLAPRSLSYQLWRKLETAIVRNASICVVVSDPLKDEFIAKARCIEVIYTTASQKHFEPAEIVKDQSFRELDELDNLRQSHQLFVFNAGNFNRWNNLDHLLTRYKELCNIAPNLILVIISHTSRQVICQALIAHGIEHDHVLLMGLASQDVPLVLRKCDYGLLVRPLSPESRGVISVKIGEYLAAGLPVIWDEYIGGAAHVIKHHQVGMLLSSDWIRNKNEFDHLQENYAEISERCRNVAKELFSVNVHAARYAKLYQEAVARGS
jgi:glycosyltransferase involved in cell wall biosynthesis